MEGYSLKKFLKSPINPLQLPYVLLALAGIGFLDALYLTIEHYRNLIPSCTLHGCDVVLTSHYATIWGLPTSLYGVFFYVAVMVLSVILITIYKKPVISNEERNLQDKQVVIPLLFLLCCSGFFVGLLLIYIQAFVLHAFCQYCLLSEVIDFLLFDASWWLYNSIKER
jgi:uncharacterized membrane protein